MKIIGYGVCGGGESQRYLKETLEEFKRLCDDVIILGNNLTENDKAMIESYQFKIYNDNREWGKLQWKIKEDFLKTQVAKLAQNGDMMVCLDMDELFCSHLTKDWLAKAPLDAYHVFVVDMWNDKEHYKPESCFWNVRIWRWNGQTKFKEKPVHCGLAPEWTYHYHRFAPFLLKHTGLMKKEDRINKIARYEKYDPNAIYLEKRFYNMLKEDKAKEFDENKLCLQIEKEVESYKQQAPREKDIIPQPRFAYLRNPGGNIVDVPERDVEQTLKRPGFTFIEWIDQNPGREEAVIPDEVNPLECALCGFVGKTENGLKAHKTKRHK